MGVSSLKDNPVYKQLQKHLPESHVRHNFFKYLVDRRGIAVRMYTKKDLPASLDGDIEALLNQEVADFS